ncbi:hypothetical protein [Nocardiopsis sp. YSL2]|uniref:hypothetical protein n=1 Tax=Nocardiopsis sp. YSL2 TaxID=2939492 RepID=UPI0026F41A0F|nr:hypothetical protein [Nocardiopsis sp. YSL2]
MTVNQRLRQQRLAETLLALVVEDASPAEWTLSADEPGLYGHVFADNDERAQLEGLAAWQRVLGAGPVTHAVAGDYDHLSITGSYDGVPVEVITMIPTKRKATS